MRSERSVKYASCRLYHAMTDFLKDVWDDGHFYELCKKYPKSFDEIMDSMCYFENHGYENPLEEV